jgi:hypothetical protein
MIRVSVEMIKESHFEIEHEMAVLKTAIIPQIKRLVFDLALRSPRFDPRIVGGQSGTGTGIFPSTSALSNQSLSTRDPSTYFILTTTNAALKASLNKAFVARTHTHTDNSVLQYAANVV